MISKPIYFDSNNQPHQLGVDDKILWRVSGYALILNDEQKLLTVTPTWRTSYDLPGGGIEAGESIAQGIARECYEETGYKIEIDSSKLFHFSETDFYHNGNKFFYHSVNLFFRGRLLSDIQNPEIINTVEPNEVASVNWIKLSDCQENLFHNIYHPVITKLKNGTT